MEHGPAETIEHVQHDAHHAQDDFSKFVAITVAILAAGIAFVSGLSHNIHNEVLSKQIQAGIDSNKGANQWARYQATNIRFHAYKTQVALVESDPNAAAKESRKSLVEGWTKKIDEYETTDGKGGTLPQIKKSAEEFDHKAEAALSDSEHIHHKAGRIDLGNLGLQFGVVLASLAILTKRREFWFAGITFGLAGFLWAMAGYFEIGLPHGGHHDAASTEHKADDHGEKKAH
jgi:Domain of unknown function (DUF4337)